MVKYITAASLTAVLFLGMILLLAAKPRFAGKMTGTFLIVAVLGGLFFYGYGFSATIDSFPIGVIRALLAVCGMFVGKMDYASVMSAPGLGTDFAQFIFWVVHLLALYATASAAITTVGAEALRKLRLMLVRRGEMNLIYGLSDETLCFGRELAARKNSAVVFVDRNPSADHIAAASKAGLVLRTDKSALGAEVKFLKSVGIGANQRKVNVYVLDQDISEGLGFATALLDSLKTRGVKPEQTNLVLLGREDASARELQVLGDRYGYGYVTVFQEAGMVARLLMRTFPPCDSISFDSDGRAKEDFEALVIGFGQIGQAVLKQLIMNSQFAGSTFHASVFAPDCGSAKGCFTSNQELMKHYDISLFPFDGRSEELFTYLKQRGSRIRYVVVCAGSEKINNEISEELLELFEKLNLDLAVYQCTYQGVRRYGVATAYSKQKRLYQADTLENGLVDQMAMLLNQHYCKGNGLSAVENWMACDYFSRMSSRASADFLPAMLRAAAVTEDEAVSGAWQFSAAKLENLSRTEHMRWCAFHYCMGFSPMDEREFSSRAQEYLRQIAQNGHASIRVGKNMRRQTHACLVDWEELDRLSEREQRLTGRSVDYKSLDRDNVLAVPELLLAKKNAEVAYGKK